jgi:hypothetical protein
MRAIKCQRAASTHLIGQDLMYALCHAEYLVFIARAVYRPNCGRVSAHCASSGEAAGSNQLKTRFLPLASHAPVSRATPMRLNTCTSSSISPLTPPPSPSRAPNPKVLVRTREYANRDQLVRVRALGFVLPSTPSRRLPRFTCSRRYGSSRSAMRAGSTSFRSAVGPGMAT